MGCAGRTQPNNWSVGSESNPLDGCLEVHFVHYVGQLLSSGESLAVTDCFGQVAAHGVGGVPRGVRADDDVVELEQWIGGVDGLGGEDVEARGL